MSRSVEAPDLFCFNDSGQLEGFIKLSSLRNWILSSNMVPGYIIVVWRAWRNVDLMSVVGYAGGSDLTTSASALCSAALHNLDQQIPSQRARYSQSCISLVLLILVYFDAMPDNDVPKNMKDYVGGANVIDYF